MSFYEMVYTGESRLLYKGLEFQLIPLLLRYEEIAAEKHVLVRKILLRPIFPSQ